MGRKYLSQFLLLIAAVPLLISIENGEVKNTNIEAIAVSGNIHFQNDRDERQLHIQIAKNKFGVDLDGLHKQEEKAPKNNEKKKPISATVSNKEKWEYYTLTAYDNGYSSTGKHPGDKGYGVTKSGEKTVEGRTVSADPRVLPLGTIIYIENVGERVVTDTGSAIKGKRLDLYFESHKKALQFGKQKLKVKILKKAVK